jgi:hypothetical protein
MPSLNSLDRSQVRRKLRLALAERPAGVNLDVSFEEDLSSLRGDLEGPSLYLKWIENASGYRGAAADALTRLLIMADEVRLPVVLSIVDDDAQLRAYYTRFGFESDPAGGEVMCRPASVLS